MSLSFKLFVTIVILKNVGNSKADIPNCDYFDTVDISDLNRVNDTYIYQGLEIPSNLIAEYNYKKLRDGSIKPVKTHLRACVCEVMPCVRICCPRKNMLTNGTCNDGFDEEITLKMVNVTLEDRKSHKIRNLGWITNYFRLRDQFEKCDTMLSLNSDDYLMLKDGTLVLKNLIKIWTKEIYCLYPQFNSDNPNSIWVVKHECTEYVLPGQSEIKAISVICYIVTLFVYLYVRKLQNVLGKCLISTIICLLIRNLFYILETFHLLSRICLLAGYSRYYIGIAKHLWFCVVSFHLWELLTNRSEQFSFVTYTAFAWGMAAFPPGLIYLVNLIWEEDLHKWNWLPIIGYSDCWLQGWSQSYWIYYEGPVLILTLFNITMFILTVTYVWKVKSELRKFKRDEERTIQCCNFDTETYLMFLRLSFIMGAFWILHVFFWLQNNSFFQKVFFIVAYMQLSLGIIVFMLLILKRSTLKLLMERIRER